MQRLSQDEYLKEYIPLSPEQAAKVGEANQLRLELRYELGGMNYFCSRQEIRGLYFSISPVSVKPATHGGTIESYSAFSGMKKLVRPLNRKNDRVGQTLAAQINQQKLKDLATAFINKDRPTLIALIDSINV